MKGFTLTEVMIMMAIIGILSVVGLNIYFGSGFEMVLNSSSNL